MTGNIPIFSTSYVSAYVKDRIKVSEEHYTLPR